jgi:hypothetical protein
MYLVNACLAGVCAARSKTVLIPSSSPDRKQYQSDNVSDSPTRCRIFVPLLSPHLLTQSVRKIVFCKAIQLSSSRGTTIEGL